MDEYYESLSKCILQMFNLALNVIGIALIGIGAYIQVKLYLSADTSYTSYITPSFFIIVGVFIITTDCLPKSFLQLFQRVFISIGNAVIGIGFYIKMQAEVYLVISNTGSPYLFNLGVMICYAGSAIFMIVFFVFDGACKEMFMHVSTSTRKYSSTSTRTFKFHISAIVIIILLVEFGVGIFAYVLYSVPPVSLQNDMENGLVNYGQEGHGAWYRVQREFECCGVTNYTDWAGVGSFTEGQTPDACCKEVSEVGCGLDTDAATKYTRGCLSEFQEHIGHVLSIIGVMGGVVIGTFIIKLIGICVAWRWLSYQLAFKEIEVHKFGKQFFKITEI